MSLVVTSLRILDFVEINVVFIDLLQYSDFTFTFCLLTIVQYKRAYICHNHEYLFVWEPKINKNVLKVDSISDSNQ